MDLENLEMGTGEADIKITSMARYSQTRPIRQPKTH
jgi:hypothetical protein